MRHLYILLLGIFFANPASATNIFFDVDGFVGSWGVDTGPTYWGNQTIDLASGSHTLSITGGGTVNFTVNSGGSVTSGDLLVMTHSGSTLTFNNLDIYFDVGDFNQVYTISYSPFKLGSATYRLPAGISLSINIPVYQNVSSFSIDASGNVTVASGAGSFSGGTQELIFSSLEILVDPQNFPGVYYFYGKSFSNGNTTQYLLPNSNYQIGGITGAIFGSVSVGGSSLITTATTPIKATGNKVIFYQCEYKVNPPSGYTSPWHFSWGYPQVTGVGDVWLLRGTEGKLHANGVDYNFTTSSACADFSVSTSVGTFLLEPVDDSDIYFDVLTEDGFNPIANGYGANRYDGRFSLDPNDYALTVNGNSVVLTYAEIDNDSFRELNAFAQGRNEVVLNGKDEDGNSFQVSKVFWAGGAEVTVTTFGATDTVTLRAEQIIDGVRYTQTIEQNAVDYEAVFQNIPQMENGTIFIGTSRSQEIFNYKISDQLNIKL